MVGGDPIDALSKSLYILRLIPRRMALRAILQEIYLCIPSTVGTSRSTMNFSRFQCLCAAGFFALTPVQPDNLLNLARTDLSVASKITHLKQLVETFPNTDASWRAQSELVSLLAGSNRWEEALQVYQSEHAKPGSGDSIDFKLLDYWLKTGRYQDVLRATAAASGPTPDVSRDMNLLEVRAQAFLARGQYRLAREAVDSWIMKYREEGAAGTRFESDFQSLRYLRSHLRALERRQGAEGKALFTASVPDSLQHWSQRRDVPIYFFKLVPTHPAGGMMGRVYPGRHEVDDFFSAQVDDMNRGLGYLSGDKFSLEYKGLDTLYVQDGDMDPTSSGAHLLTSRVWAHSLPQLYKLAGQAFVVLVDYRISSDGEAAYMGDGIIHVSASKFQSLVLIHEVLHGLGATHNEWALLSKKGYQFDSDDRGIMTFDQGEIRDLGLEEKNRAVLGWPRVAVVHFAEPSDGSLPNLPTAVASNSSLFAGLN